MPYDPEIHNRRSIRLTGYNYSQPGAYFVTLCTHNRSCLFGDIVDGKMIANALGRFASTCWDKIPSHNPHVTLDAFVIMPNHLHGVLYIDTQSEENIGANDYSFYTSRPTGTSKTLGSILRGFKIGVTKWVRQNTKIKNPWQRGFYEHIIRNEEDLDMVREYIMTNPKNWNKDKLHPVFGKGS
ncbi:MAG: transposase [Thermodesulfobacteriota bacterium]